MPAIGGGAYETGLQALVDALGRLRYGVPTAEKERLAIEGSLPGAPVVPNTPEQPEAQRYASGYLFKKAHPLLSDIFQPVASAIRGSVEPQLQPYADVGAANAAIDPRSLEEVLAAIEMKRQARRR